MRHRRWAMYTGLLSLLLVLILSVFVTMQKAHAGSAYGDSGSTSGGSSGSGYYTTHGFGWELFNVTSGGPSGGFKSGNWGSISVQCAILNDNRVWVHVVRNSSGQEKSYSYEGASYNSDRPASGLDPYDYNVSGAYSPQGAAYQQQVINIVSVVHGYYLQANPSGSGWGVSIGWFCWSDAPPNPPWSVTTSTSVDRAYAEPGELITWTHKVTNGGPNNTNKDVTFKYNNAGSLPAGSGGNWTLPSGTSSGNGSRQASTYVPQASDFGKQVCRTTSASPSTNNGGTYTDSPATCVTIGKKPKVQVHGNDLILGRPFIGGAQQLSSANTSISQLNSIPSGASGNVFGSWIEYGIFATKNIVGLGSGSAFAGGANASDVCSYSLLTFVNATTSNPATACSGSTTAGGYATGRTIPDVQSDFPVVSGTPVYDDTAAAPQGLYTSDASADPITVAASGVKTIKKGEWVVINAPNADVTIANDITYDTSPLQSIYDIPQLVIIAKDIYISPTVKQVDAWLVAQGSTTAGTGLLDTCHISNDYTTQLSTTICNKVLQVNGPVMAQKLWLRRTGGATTADPAEVFNLRPDAYMWGYARASTSGRVQTIYSQELPPRF